MILSFIKVTDIDIMNYWKGIHYSFFLPWANFDHLSLSSTRGQAVTRRDKNQEKAVDSGFSSHAGKCQLKTAWLCAWENLSSYQAEENQVLWRNQRNSDGWPGHPWLKQETNWKHIPVLKRKTPHPKLNLEKSHSQPCPRSSKSLSRHQSFSTWVFQKIALNQNIPYILIVFWIHIYLKIEIEIYMPIHGQEVVYS